MKKKKKKKLTSVTRRKESVFVSKELSSFSFEMSRTILAPVAADKFDNNDNYSIHTHTYIVV